MKVFTRDSPNEDNAELDSEELTDFEDVLEKMRCEEGFFLLAWRLAKCWQRSGTVALW